MGFAEPANLAKARQGFARWRQRPQGKTVVPLITKKLNKLSKHGMFIKNIG